ncbi:MAG: MFS transporter [Micrococcaceae bacterium]
MSNKRPLRWLWPLACAGLLSQATIHMVRPVTTYKLIELDADGFIIGLVTGIYALLPLVLALVIGARAQVVWSFRGLMVSGLSLIVVGAGLLALIDEVIGIAMGSAVLGLGQLIFTLASQAAVARFTPAQYLDTAFGWYSAGLAGGQLVGPFIAGVMLGTDAASSEFRLEPINLTMWAGSILALIGIAFLYVHRAAFRGHGHRETRRPTGSTAEEHPSTESDRKASMSSILRFPRMKSHIFTSVTLLCVLDILSAFMPLLGEEAGISPFWVGALLSIRAGASIASRVLLPLLRRRWSRETLVLWTLWGAGIALAFMPFGLDQLWIALTLMVVSGLFLGLGHPLMMAVITESVPRSWTSTALTVRIMGNRLGQVIIPVTAGVVAVPLGPAGAVWAGCILLFASGAEKGLHRYRSGRGGDTG